MRTQTAIPKDDHGQQQASAQLESIRELVKALKDSDPGSVIEENRKAYDIAVTAIQEDALSVEARSGWHSSGEPGTLSEYMILLCTGGPACRIIGDLDQYCQPESARIEYQDWGTPWTDFPLDSEEEEDVLTYSRQFYFGE